MNRTPEGDMARRRSLIESSCRIAWIFIYLGLPLTACLSLPLARAESTANLDSLISEALRINPALQASREYAMASDQVPPRVGSLPDPMFGMSVSNFRVDDPSLTASPMSGVPLILRQHVPFPGKLGRRKDVAKAGALAAWSQVELKEAELIAQVKRAYWSYYFATASEAITRENLTLLNTLVDVANARFAVGRAAQQDVLKATVAHLRLQDGLLIREQVTMTSREQLNTVVGRQPWAPLGTPEPPPDDPLELQAEAFIEEALENSPQLSVERASVEQSVRQIREASYDRWPDLQLDAAYRIRGVVPGDGSAGANMFSVGLAISVPIFAHSKQNKRVEETKRRKISAEHRLSDRRLAVGFSVRRLLDETHRLTREVELYRSAILPEAELALNSSLTDYRVARVEFLSVLDNWQRLFDAKITYERVLSERASRLADFEAVIGRQLP